MLSTIKNFNNPNENKAIRIQPKMPGGRLGVIITLLAGVLLMLDYTLETTFAAAKVLDIDRESNRINTEMGAFLAEFNSTLGPRLAEGDVIVLELSKISNTVVAYQPQDSLFVYVPRQSIFDFWYLALGVCIISIYLLVRWNQTEYRFELLMANLIMLVVLGLLYFVTR